MTFEDRVKEALGSLKVQLNATVEVELKPTTPWRYYAVARSRGFDGIDEHARQIMVWHVLRDEIKDDQDRDRIEFVFTESPNDPPDGAPDDECKRDPGEAA